MSQDHYNIPNIIHQLWIGDVAPRPQAQMDTWRDRHPDYQYILWDEAKLVELNVDPMLQNTINQMGELVGKVDIYRWFILYKYGGVFLDADSVCLAPIDQDLFLKGRQGFAAFENENTRAGLVAIGTMGFIPKHPLVGDILSYLRTEEAHQQIRSYKAWYSVGPGLLTKMLNLGIYRDMITIFPSYMFIPAHFTGDVYRGYKKVYAYQEWSNTKTNYDVLCSPEYQIPEEYRPNYMDVLAARGRMISILVPSYNTPRKFLVECLRSIRNQTYDEDPIGYELVWINDGSDEEHTKILETELATFEATTRFIRVVYHREPVNQGIAKALQIGLEKCSYELVARMDADDIMLPWRLIKQYNYMMSRPGLALSSTAIMCFRDQEGGTIVKSHKPVLRREDAESREEWISNHPTMMMRKSMIMSIGGYRETLAEDWDLIQRVLDRYQEIHNMQEVLLYYRIHSGQVTKNLIAEADKRENNRIQEEEFIKTFGCDRATLDKKLCDNERRILQEREAEYNEWIQMNENDKDKYKES
jgi:glycosyltransferase involved in cell wall biosynthesis